MKWSLILWGMTGLFRLLIFYIVWIVLMIAFWFYSIVKGDKVDFSSKGSKRLRWLQVISAKICLCTFGIFDWEIKYKHVDYSKYLGPDWNADLNKKPLAIINNH